MENEKRNQYKGGERKSKSQSKKPEKFSKRNESKTNPSEKKPYKPRKPAPAVTICKVRDFRDIGVIIPVTVEKHKKFLKKTTYNISENSRLIIKNFINANKYLFASQFIGMEQKSEEEKKKTFASIASDSITNVEIYELADRIAKSFADYVGEIPKTSELHHINRKKKWWYCKDELNTYLCFNIGALIVENWKFRIFKTSYRIPIGFMLYRNVNLDIEQPAGWTPNTRVAVIDIDNYRYYIADKYQVSMYDNNKYAIYLNSDDIFNESQQIWQNDDIVIPAVIKRFKTIKYLKKPKPEEK